MPTLRRLRTLHVAIFAIALCALAFGSLPACGIEPFRGWAPLKTRPLRAKYAVRPSKAIFPQPLATIPPNPTPYPYGYFGAAGNHPNVQTGPGSLPGAKAWSFSDVR